MSDNSFNSEAAAAVPEQENTATPETENQTPGDQEPRTFTQEELDAAVEKRLGIERRKLKREQQQAVEQRRPAATDVPKREAFQTEQAYQDALIDHRVERKIAEREQQQHLVKTQTVFEDREDEARTKYADYEKVVRDDDLRITPYMAETIMESNLGPDIAYHLGKNPKEADRIAGLSPLTQAREIGKIEASLQANPPEAKKVSNAPEPIAPVGTRASTQKYDPSDPRSTQTMSPEEWVAARNKQVRNKHL